MQRISTNLRRVVCCALACIAPLSARAQFTTIINVPPNIPNSQTIDSNTQVNMTSGSIGPVFNAGNPNGSSTNVEVNVFGGTVGAGFNAYNGSTVNLYGGTINDTIDAYSGSTFQISGGRMGDVFRGFPGSHVVISGGEFRLNGTLIEGLETVPSILPFDLPEGSVLSGTLADGTPFAFSSNDTISSFTGGDTFPSGSLELRAVALPATGPSTITLNSANALSGIRDGQTLIMQANGRIGRHFSAGWGSSVMMTGGFIDQNFEAVGASIVASGGTIGFRFDAYTGTSVMLSGNVSAQDMEAHAGSFVHFIDGVFGGYTTGITAFDGSMIHISGGQFGVLGTYDGSSVKVFGGEFRLDGVEVAFSGQVGSELPVNVPENSVLTGVFADGRTFAFSSKNSNTIANGTVTLVRADVPPIGPSTFHLPNAPPLRDCGRGKH
jgi:hypothetical protein